MLQNIIIQENQDIVACIPIDNTFKQKKCYRTTHKTNCCRIKIYFLRVELKKLLWKHFGVHLPQVLHAKKLRPCLATQSRRLTSYVITFLEILDVVKIYLTWLLARLQGTVKFFLPPSPKLCATDNATLGFPFFICLFLILPSIRYGSYQKQVHIETKELFGTKAVKVR